MRLSKTQVETLKNAVGSEVTSKVNDTIKDGNVFGWSVFDSEGSELAGGGVSETMTAVCSNVLDMATHVGSDMGEDTRPTITFGKSGKGIQMVPLNGANMLIVREKPARKE